MDLHSSHTVVAVAAAAVLVSVLGALLLLPLLSSRGLLNHVGQKTRLINNCSQARHFTLRILIESLQFARLTREWGVSIVSLNCCNILGCFHLKQLSNSDPIHVYRNWAQMFDGPITPSVFLTWFRV